MVLKPETEEAGTRLDAWLAGKLEGVSRSGAVRLVEEGRVTCGGKPLEKKYKVRGGEAIEVEQQHFPCIHGCLPLPLHSCPFETLLYAH